MATGSAKTASAFESSASAKSSAASAGRRCWSSSAPSASTIAASVLTSEIHATVSTFARVQQEERAAEQRRQRRDAGATEDATSSTEREGVERQVRDVVAAHVGAEELPLRGVEQQVDRRPVRRELRRVAPRIEDREHVRRARLSHPGVVHDEAVVVGDERRRAVRARRARGAAGRKPPRAGARRAARKEPRAGVEAARERRSQRGSRARPRSVARAFSSRPRGPRRLRSAGGRRHGIVHRR